MTEYRARVEDLLAEYRRSREQLAEVHHQLGKITASAGSADGSVTATVGPRGTLTGLTITDEAYRRYQPAELAAQILKATAAASASALAETSAALAPVLPSGTDPEAVLLGTGDLSAAELRPEPVPQPAVVEEEDFESQSWFSR
ncbi:MAG: YbaB/EbfC family nucleoid-associated protein [Thermocrispum sp.]